MGVEFKLLLIQLITCSVCRSLMTSQICESESKLPQSYRRFRAVILIQAYLSNRDECSQTERRGGVDFFCPLTILKFQDPLAKFLFLFSLQSIVSHCIYP